MRHVRVWWVPVVGAAGAVPPVWGDSGRSETRGVQRGGGRAMLWCVIQETRSRPPAFIQIDPGSAAAADFARGALRLGLIPSSAWTAPIPTWRERGDPDRKQSRQKSQAVQVADRA